MVSIGVFDTRVRVTCKRCGRVEEAWVPVSIETEPRSNDPEDDGEVIVARTLVPGFASAPFDQGTVCAPSCQGGGQTEP